MRPFPSSLFSIGRLLCCVGMLSLLRPCAAAESFVATLPGGISPIWETSRAYREITPTRERVCLNGLWRWQPSDGALENPPSSRWGYFKVPGAWPGVTDYMQKDSQTVFANDAWKSERLSEIKAAWYEREFEAPENWKGRQIQLSTEYLNSHAVVFIDGKKAGEMRFPAGTVDLTQFCEPGRKHKLSVLVTALPLKAVLMSYMDSAHAREIKGAVARRGLCGDVFLEAIQLGAGIDAVQVVTSFRDSEIKFAANLHGLEQTTLYHLRAEISGSGDGTESFDSPQFTAAELRDHPYTFAKKWKPSALWGVHTPQNQLKARVRLVAQNGSTIDESSPVSFGFRELWIDGRDFYLNGSRIFLSAVPLDNAQVGAAWATYEGTRESLERLKGFGINFVYTHNYDCRPGSHLSFLEILRAADDVGMLVALTQPHFSDYDWKGADADKTNGYAEHARFYAQVAANHPSVVFYSMSHNATGYSDDMTPDMIDGIRDGRDRWASNNAALARRAEKIVEGIDPSRVVYHHASGNLGSMHAINFYPNFVPPQELSDWFGHWATNGVKPVFLCEYGAPFTWDWTMYRGWYKGQREFGSAKVPWEFCLAEWNAQFIGAEAYRISDAEKSNLRWEGKQFGVGASWHRWDYPNQVGSSVFDERYPIFALYLKENWRAFRGWGVSALSPWEYEHFWKLRRGVEKKREELPVDWENLQRPGYSADYINDRYERMDLAFRRDDWIPTEAAKTLIQHNGPLLGFIAGKEAAFTSKDHNFRAGEEIEKQLIVINNSRETVTCKLDWSFQLPQRIGGSREITLPTGDQARIGIRALLPNDLPPGVYEVKAKFDFKTGAQKDSFKFEVLPSPAATKIKSHIAVFDPDGVTTGWLKGRGVAFDSVDAAASLSKYDVLIVGKRALSVSGAAPDVSRVRDGLKVIVFEQTAETLEKRFGFRVAEYGLRNVFARVPDDPLLSGITADELRDWRGSSTLLPPRLNYQLDARLGPVVKWAGIDVPHLWRCGNVGNVASALIEKPVGGNFRPIVDGGFGLQYSPLLEYREGKGIVLFCQLDVTGRGEDDPAGERIKSNILETIADWKPNEDSQRPVVYFGESAGKAFFNSVGVRVFDVAERKVPVNSIVVVGPDGGKVATVRKGEIAEALRNGGKLLVVGLGDAEANSFLPAPVKTKSVEHIADYFAAPSARSMFAGIAPADLHNRDPRNFHVVSEGVTAIGKGLLATSADEKVVFFQIPPWRFDSSKPMNQKRTFRRVSFALSRALGNLGAMQQSPIIDRFGKGAGDGEKRWLTGLYLDTPEDWDDPYRFFRW